MGRRIYNRCVGFTEEAERDKYSPYKQAAVILYMLDALDCLAIAALIGHFAKTQAVSIPVLM